MPVSFLSPAQRDSYGRSLGASSGRSETPLTAVANRTFRSIAPQTPRWHRGSGGAGDVGVGDRHGSVREKRAF